MKRGGRGTKTYVEVEELLDALYEAGVLTQHIRKGEIKACVFLLRQGLHKND